MQIKELETTLDLQLVERSPKGASLTTDGQAIADRARRILTDISALEDFARARAPVLSGPLRLGVIPSVAPYLLPKVLPTLKALYPELALQISETQTERLVAQLLDGDIDLLLLALPILDPGITTRVLFDDPFVLAAPSRVAQNADPLSLLAEEKVLLLEDGHCLRDQALSFCADRKTGAIDAFGASTLATVVHDPESPGQGRVGSHSESGHRMNS